MALPQSEMSLLQPSSSIGTTKKSRKQILREISQQKHLRTTCSSSSSEKRVKSLNSVLESERDDFNLVGTSWRRGRGRGKKKRRKLKVEKVMLDPKPPPSVFHETGEGEDGSCDEQQVEEDENGDSSGGTCTYVRMYEHVYYISWRCNGARHD